MAQMPGISFAESPFFRRKWITYLCSNSQRIVTFISCTCNK
jgi:hypothetical protein